MPFVATAATLSFFCVVLSARSVDSHTAGCPVYLGWKHHRTSMRGVRLFHGVCRQSTTPTFVASWQRASLTTYLLHVVCLVVVQDVCPNGDGHAAR
jgi:hypothetical protein